MHFSIAVIVQLEVFSLGGCIFIHFWCFVSLKIVLIQGVSP